MRVNLVSRSGIVLVAFAVLALILYLLSVLLSLPSEAHTVVQAVAEALVVSIVVALAVEPCLLRHFGEELASQTFWTSFYSRAPEEYREAIRELASATQFAGGRIGEGLFQGARWHEGFASATSGSWARRSCCTGRDTSPRPPLRRPRCVPK